MSLEEHKMADVSVIVPAYRAAFCIGQALASVAAQTLKPGEVIVVDDGSDDGTFEAAEAMREKMNGVELRVIAQQNKGAGAARNHALREAKLTFVAFLDADDEWMAEKIERSMAALHGTNHVLVAHDFIRVEIDGSENTVECARRFQQASDPYIGLFRQGFIATSSVVCRRAEVVEVGGFDEALATAQDFELWLKLLARDGATFSIFPNVLSRYHVTGSSITSFTARRLACSLDIARRHAPGLFDLLFRILAVHFEAMIAYRRGGFPFKALLIGLQLPWNLLAISLASGQTSPRAATPQWLVLALLAWVVVGFGAYVYRFRDLVHRGLDLLEQL